MKVHKASVEMVRAMVHDMKSLGVPYFGVPEYLIRDTTRDDVPGGSTAAEGREPRITRHELLVLQKKMLELLETLCQE